MSTDRHWLQLAVEHHQAGRLREAHELYGRILQADPNNTYALRYLGLMAQQLGNHDQAIALIEQAHRHGRPDAQSLNTLGLAHAAAGRFADARRWFGKAVGLKPDYADAHGNLGSALRALGELKEAQTSYRRALALDPGSAEAHYNLGNLLVELRNAAEAEKHFRGALRLRPEYVQAHNNLGHALQLLGRAEEAAQSYRAALALDPQLFEAKASLGNVMHRLGRLDDAVACHREALALRPELAAAHYNLGNSLAAFDRWEEAAASYANAIALQSDFAAARWALAMVQLPSVYEGEEQLALRRSAFARELDGLARWLAEHPGVDGADAFVQQPFQLAYQEDNNRDLLARCGQLCADVMQRWRGKQRFASPRARTGRTLRFGIASAHIHEHSVWHAILKGWLQRLERERVEVHLFHLGGHSDAETAFAKSRAAQLVQGAGSLRDWAGAILEQQLDMLAFPEVGMHTLTAQLASLRLAPVQLASWGHPETTGIPTVDYYLSADAFEPADAQQHYTEKLVRLPNLGCFYEPYGTEPAATDLAALGIPDDEPLLLCAGTPSKYLPTYDRLLTAIAKELGACRFIFFSDPRIPASGKLRARLERSFDLARLDFNRYLAFVPWQPRAQFYGLMARAQVLLDTVGFSGFNTAMQAVECGLPIVATEGRFMRGRFGSAILKRMGLDELVARSEAAYVEIAARLARDEDYRGRMRRQVEHSRDILYADKTATGALQDFLASRAG